MWEVTVAVRPEVAIVILTWNGVEYTRACLESLHTHTASGPGVRVIVVDNGSTDGTIDYLRGLDWITLIENGRNLGFSRGCNIGIAAAGCDCDVILLNNDVVIGQDNWLGELQQAAYAEPDVGIVGCRLILPDGRLLHAGAEMPRTTFWGQQIGSLEKDVNQYSADRTVESVVGACMYIRRAVLEVVGSLDEVYTSYFEDTDFCLRAAQAGFRTVCAGGVTLTHHENTSTRVNRVDFGRVFRRSQRVFRRRWEPQLRTKPIATVLWHSEVGSDSGYAVSSRELVVALDRMGVAVHLANLYGTDWMDTQRDTHRIAAMRARPKDLRLPQVVYAPGELFAKNSGRYRIGYTMLEVDGVPDEWVHLCNEMDEVWVPSTFNQDTFRSAGVKRPIFTMPLGVDPDLHNPQIKAFRASSRYTFLSVFEWGERKAPDVLLRAYTRAFKRDDDVLLLLKVTNRDPGVDVLGQIAALDLPSDAPPIALLLNRELPAHQMGSLYRSADCFVLPTRGEGFGLPILEAQACGLPVIATAWSAQQSLLDEALAYPLQVAKLVPAAAKCPYYRGSRWAQPDEEHLIELMRHVAAHPQEAVDKGRRASDTALARMTWHHAAQHIVERLLAIGEPKD